MRILKIFILFISVIGLGVCAALWSTGRVDNRTNEDQFFTTSSQNLKQVQERIQTLRQLMTENQQSDVTDSNPLIPKAPFLYWLKMPLQESTENITKKIHPALLKLIAPHTLENFEKRFFSLLPQLKDNCPTSLTPINRSALDSQKQLLIFCQKESENYFFAAVQPEQIFAHMNKSSRTFLLQSDGKILIHSNSHYAGFELKKILPIIQQKIETPFLEKIAYTSFDQLHVKAFAARLTPYDFYFVSEKIFTPPFYQNYSATIIGSFILFLFIFISTFIFSISRSFRFRKTQNKVIKSIQTSEPIASTINTFVSSSQTKNQQVKEERIIAELVFKFQKKFESKKESLMLDDLFLTLKEQIEKISRLETHFFQYLPTIQAALLRTATSPNRYFKLSNQTISELQQIHKRGEVPSLIEISLIRNYVFENFGCKDFELWAMLSPDSNKIIGLCLILRPEGEYVAHRNAILYLLEIAAQKIAQKQSNEDATTTTSKKETKKYTFQKKFNSFEL